jgi:NADH dehydrogenase FAD-containing subunit
MLDEWWLADIFWNRVPTNNKKKIVILGGGFCGITATKLLDPLAYFDLVMIDTKEYFEYTPAMVQAITDPSIVHRATIPYKEIIKNGTFIQGYVSRVYPDFVKLGCWKIPFDYLVFSIGCSYGSTLKASNISTIYRNKKLNQLHRKLTEAKHVLIVGGGMVLLAVCMSRYSPVDRSCRG